jgi:hypothetical protein
VDARVEDEKQPAGYRRKRTLESGAAARLPVLPCFGQQAVNQKIRRDVGLGIGAKIEEWSVRANVRASGTFEAGNMDGADVGSVGSGRAS